MLTTTNHTISRHLQNARRQCSMDALCWGFSKAIAYGFAGILAGFAIATVRVSLDPDIFDPKDNPILPTCVMLGGTAGAIMGFFKGFTSHQYYNMREQEARHQHEEKSASHEIVNLLRNEN